MAKHPKCPNCDLPTMRTKDWACQWCGYPLVSESFQQVSQTYQELRAERMSEPAPSETAETDVSAESNKCPNCGLPTMRTRDWACRWCGYPLVSESLQQTAQTYQEARAGRTGEMAPSETAETDAPTENAEADTFEEETESAAAVPPARVVESAVDAATEARPAPEIIPVEDPQPTPAPEAEETAEVEVEASPRAELEQEPAQEPEPKPVMKRQSSVADDSVTATETTVAELCSSYQSYGMAGHDEFKSRVFRVTGTVAGVTIRNATGQYYVALTDSTPHPLGDIHCMFEREDVSELRSLTTGQELTIQGRYDGFVTEMVLAGCAIIH